MPILRLQVLKYIPEHLYGFVGNAQGQAFFHLGNFDPGPHPAGKGCGRCSQKPEPCTIPEAPSPPVLGEYVDVDIDVPLVQEGQGRAPKANRVTRVQAPKFVTARVDTFDHQSGYGFAQGNDGVAYHLHRSEVLGGRVPVVGQIVSFLAGERRGKPRACHVRICE